MDERDTRDGAAGPEPALDAVLARLRDRSGRDTASAGRASFVATWLEGRDDVTVEAPARPDGGLEPYGGLLVVYERLDRALSEILYRRAYNEEPPLLGSDFGDWAVGSLARETCLDLRLGAVAAGNGLDAQVMCLLRHMAELSWRALVVTADPTVADEWWRSVVASAETGDRARREKRLWQRHFRPARQIESVARIEARLDGLEGEPAEERVAATIAQLARLYSLMSGSTHGGTDLVFASATRGGTRLPHDPFATLGTPTALSVRLTRAAVHLQWRFWRYFPRAAFPGAEGTAPLPPPRPGQELADPDETALLWAAALVTETVTDLYPAYLTFDEPGGDG